MNGKPYKKPTRPYLKKLLTTHSVLEASRVMGCARSMVYIWAADYGLCWKEREIIDIPSGKELARLCERLDDAQLAKKFGCSEQTIRERRHASRIFRSRARRRYTLDEAFFEKIDTEHKAYILGFLAADGTVSLRSVWIMLQARDVHILRDIRKAMGSNARIFERPIFPGYPNRGPYKFIYFGSQKMGADLTALGITPRKSLTLKYPKIPRRLERHFIRGLLDGDGSIKEKSFCFLGTKHVVDGLQRSIMHHTGALLTKSHQENKLWRLTGCARSAKVLSWLYEGASIYLRRKHRAFLEHWI